MQASARKKNPAGTTLFSFASLVFGCDALVGSERLRKKAREKEHVTLAYVVSASGSEDDDSGEGLTVTVVIISILSSARTKKKKKEKN